MLLVLEFLQGGNLYDKIRAEKVGNIKPRRTGWYRDGRDIALGVACGLAYLHSRHIIWFDCKPQNVLLNHTGRLAKIADFGLSQTVSKVSLDRNQVQPHLP